MQAIQMGKFQKQSNRIQLNLACVQSSQASSIPSKMTKLFFN